MKPYERGKKVYQRRDEDIFETGERQGRVITARRMKAKGYAAEDIAEITGLTAEEIEGLKI